MAISKKGRYQNASEVLRHGLRLVEDEIQRKDVMLENLRQQLNAAWSSLKREIWHQEQSMIFFQSLAED